MQPKFGSAAATHATQIGTQCETCDVELNDDDRRCGLYTAECRECRAEAIGFGVETEDDLEPVLGQPEEPDNAHKLAMDIMEANPVLMTECFTSDLKEWEFIRDMVEKQYPNLNLEGQAKIIGEVQEERETHGKNLIPDLRQKELAKDGPWELRYHLEVGHMERSFYSKGEPKKLSAHLTTLQALYSDSLTVVFVGPSALADIMDTLAYAQSGLKDELEACDGFELLIRFDEHRVYERAQGRWQRAWQYPAPSATKDWVTAETACERLNAMFRPDPEWPIPMNILIKDTDMGVYVRKPTREGEQALSPITIPLVSQKRVYQWIHNEQVKFKRNEHVLADGHAIGGKWVIDLNTVPAPYNMMVEASNEQD